MTGMVIIGAGECGTRAALALREAGFDGPVTLIGTEPHSPYERPPLSKNAIIADSPVPTAIGGADRFGAAEIDFRPARCVTAIDRAGRRVRSGDGTEISYDRLLIATGARPRTLPLPGADGQNVMVLRTLDDASRIRGALGEGRRLAIIGGGFIGLELAASARKLGTEVTIIEVQQRLLTRSVPSAIASVIHECHVSEGVRFQFGAKIEEITETGVVLADGTIVLADLVVLGVGAVPNTDLAADAGLAINNGIAVSESLVTSDQAIFAAGDCCSAPHPLYGGRRIRLESWRSAQEQGALAARNMLDRFEPISAVPWFWSDQYDLTLQIAGLADGATTEVRRDLMNGAFVLFHLASDGRLLAASGVGLGNSVAKDIRLAEMMIARRAVPDPDALSNPATSLKRLL